MNSSPDIFGLVMHYAINPAGRSTLVKWVNLADITHQASRGFSPALVPSILKNPASGDYLIKNLPKLIPEIDYKPKITHTGSVYQGIEERDYFNVLACIASQKSPNVINILEHVMKYRNLVPELDPRHSGYLGELTKNPYGYRWVLNKFPELIFEFDYSYEHILPYEDILKNLLSIHSEPIPELIKIYKSKLVETRNELRLLAKNPFMFDIFLEINKVVRDNLNLFKKEISSNTSELAISFLKENPELIDIMQILSNPSAYDLIYDYIKERDWNVQGLHLAHLCANTNPKVIDLVKKMKFVSVSIMSNSIEPAVEITMKQEYIEPALLAHNTNPKIIPLLKQNYEKLDKKALALNPLIFYRGKLETRLINRINLNIRNIMTNKVRKLMEQVHTYTNMCMKQVHVYTSVWADALEDFSLYKN